MLQKVLGANAHFQTIHPAFFRKVERTHGKQKLIEAYDGVPLQIYHHEKKSSHLAILTHGMEGDVHAPYIFGMSNVLEAHGMDTMCWNMRNCGPDPVLTPTIYHSGRYDDLERLIQYADETLGYDLISLVGFSLGGAVTMNYLGRSEKVNEKVFRACAVSSPLDLSDSVDKLHKINNRHYEIYLLWCAKQKVKRLKEKLGNMIVDTPPLITMNSFRKFDNHFTAPMIGVKDAQDYYDTYSCGSYLHKIKHDLLILNALNDPFLGRNSFPYELAAKKDNIHLMAPPKGGHVGFYDHSEDQFSSEKLVREFLTPNSH